MKNADDIFSAARKQGFEDVIIIGISEEGDLTTMHTLDDLTTMSLLEVSAGQIRRELMEDLFGRLKRTAN